MGLSLTQFLSDVISNPVMIITTLLVTGVILVNGWTDAPNAIATCVSTRAMPPRAAIIMSAIFNFLGVLVMTMINSSVANVIVKMVDFGDNTGDALLGLCAALFAIVLWAVAAWYFGIPTSESHALIAGLSGAAIAMHNSVKGINLNEWVNVLIGIVVSTLVGFAGGFFATKLTVAICRNKNRQKTNKFFKFGQIAGGAGMSFMHGAQDGQKFMAVFLLISSLSTGHKFTGGNIPIWLMIFCSVIMSLGTSIGGYRIIKAVGMDMVKLEPYQGFAADIVSTGSLLLATMLGLPVSTTHTKTVSIMGVGAAKSIKTVNWSVVREMVMAWVLTFPGCGLVAFLMVKLFLAIF